MAQNTYINMIPEPVNEGEVLTVVNGEWQSVEPSGGGASGLVVNVIRDLTAVPPTIQLDKTYTEITTALLNGIHPVVLTNDEGTYDVDTIVGFSDAEDYSVSTSANDSFTSESADGVLTLAE